MSCAKIDPALHQAHKPSWINAVAIETLAQAVALRLFVKHLQQLANGDCARWDYRSV